MYTVHARHLPTTEARLCLYIPSSPLVFIGSSQLLLIAHNTASIYHLDCYLWALSLHLPV